jgi:hypothetical protein
MLVVMRDLLNRNNWIELWPTFTRPPLAIPGIIHYFCIVRFSLLTLILKVLWPILARYAKRAKP